MIEGVRRAAVIGFGRSGRAAAKALASHGVEVTAFDAKSPEPGEFELVTDWDGRLPEGFDLVVPSPGVAKTHPALRASAMAGVPVWSEPELAYRVARAPIWAVTGTNGKSTTTAMLHSIAAAAGLRPFLCGNIAGSGRDLPLSAAALEAGPDALLVAEISSFQLEWVYRFRPRLAILTNVSPDHLERYSGFGDYFLTKERVFAQQTLEDVAVTGEMRANTREARRIAFALEPGEGDCAYVAGGRLTLRFGGETRVLADAADVPAPGEYNLLNALAASAGAGAMGVPPEAIAKGLRRFEPLPHRMSEVGIARGIRFIENSTCTNPGSLAATLRSANGPVVALIGGHDKGLDLLPIVRAAKELKRTPVIYGAVADRMAAEMDAEAVPYRRAADLADAFALAVGSVEPGDTVLLIPGCSSFDAYRDFEHRAEHFRRLVEEFAKGAGA